MRGACRVQVTCGQLQWRRGLPRSSRQYWTRPPPPAGPSPCPHTPLGLTHHCWCCRALPAPPPPVPAFPAHLPPKRPSPRPTSVASTLPAPPGRPPGRPPSPPSRPPGPTAATTYVWHYVHGPKERGRVGSKRVGGGEVPDLVGVQSPVAGVRMLNRFHHGGLASCLAGRDAGAGMYGQQQHWLAPQGARASPAMRWQVRGAGGGGGDCCCASGAGQRKRAVEERVSGPSQACGVALPMIPCCGVACTLSTLFNVSG